MPKKGKRSQAAKLRWQKVHLSYVLPNPQAESLGLQSSTQVNVSEGHRPTDVVSYADAVKRGSHTDVECVPGPSHSHSVSQGGRSDVTRVLASRSQDSSRYPGFSRNKQCTCNSLTFLAFLHENDNLSGADLDLVLDKGDVMYTQVRRRLAQEGMLDNDFLPADDLPDRVPARRHVYHVTKQLSRYGTFRDTGAEHRLLDLEPGLCCLSSDVKYALLMMTDLCIAVFRDNSGRYGFFDPHSRSPEGLPCGVGTAAMLTFTNLGDMINRLIECHNIFGTAPTCVYELTPVLFNSDDMPCQNDNVLHTTSTADTTVSLVREHKDHIISCDTQDMPSSPNLISVPTQYPISNESSLNLTSNTHATATEPSVNDQMMQINSTDIMVEHSTSDTAETGRTHMPDLSKLNKQQRKKAKRRAKHLKKEKITTKERKEAQTMKKKEMYAKDKPYQEKKRAYMTSHYRQDKLFRQRQKSYITDRYRQDKLFQKRQKSYITDRYRQDKLFQKRQKSYFTDRYRQDKLLQKRKKSYITDRYRQDKLFQKRQKSYITDRYRQDKLFQKRQKSYITDRYRQDKLFQKRQKSYITERYRQDKAFQQNQKSHTTRCYRQDTEFRQRKKSYITSCYKHDLAFQNRQKAYMTTRYANDPQFRLKHIQIMKHLQKYKYRTNLAFKILHNMQCAMKIRRKYRRMNIQNQQNVQTDNSLIRKAVLVFRSQIINGPTYVCTVCHRALFANQVRPCIRENYINNSRMVAVCLTGKYVHVCNSECQEPQRCKVPDERRKEWICYTCNDHLKRGSMPSLAVANKLELAEIPPELSDLNILERHLIAKCITFAKIIPLPKGQQRAIRGNVVCVPSEVQEIVDALPRLRSESQVMRVKLKRRLSYKGHQVFQTVSWPKLMRSLHKLKEIHPQYKDITIRDEAEFCDPTLDDDNSDDDHTDENMESDDYDENDLMQIDRCESSAMCEAQQEHEGEQNDNILLCVANQPEEQSADTEQDGDEPNGGVVLESCLQPSDIGEEILTFSEGIYCMAPCEGKRPVSFFKTPKLEAIAFPVQYPTGENTLDDQRAIHLSPSSYFKARLFCVDDRFARDTNYLFFAQFVTEVHMATSSMKIQLRKGKPVTRDGRKINSRMLQDKHEVEKLVRNKDAVRFMEPLRGTPAYWAKTTRDLFAMIRQLGTPTFFCTFSAAEMRWPEVIEAIKTQQGEQVNFEELDWATKCEILRSNPVTTMRMFDHRVDALFRDLILSPAQPIGKVVDYFYRLEFQARGSGHIHCLFWVEGAPVFEDDSDKTVCDFIDKYITAQLPDENTQPELHRKVKELQMHSKNHSKSCHKNKKPGCRFGFPKPPASETMITRPGENTDSAVLTAAKEKLKPVTELLNDPQTACVDLPELLARCNLSCKEYEQCLELMTSSSVVIMKRDPKDCWVNGYNPHLLDAWDANIDIQYILNPYSCIMYITSYITKAEHGMSEYLKSLIQNTDTNRTDYEEMKQIMQAYSKKREVSAQECVTRVCGIHMKKCSRKVIFIPTDDNALKMSYPMSLLENRTDDSVDVWMTGLREKYRARPETPEFEMMCLADFASGCRIVYGRQKNGKNVVPLLNEMGFVQIRTKGNAVIRYHRYSQEKNPEEFYSTLLKLYLPHRSESQLKSQWYPTYESFYSRACVQLPGSDLVQPVCEIVKENRAKYEKHSEEIEKAIEEFEQNGPMRDEWCNLAPESELVRLECIEELERVCSNDPNEQEDVPEYSLQSEATSTTTAMVEGPQINPAVLRQLYQNLNQKQASVFYKVRDWCIKCVCGLNPDQFFYFINGGAGTGKSHLIKCIYSDASKILCKLPRNSEETDISMPTVLLTAFTGTAAFNISGKTLHSILKLPRSLKPPFQGLGNALDEVRAELSNAEIIVIDEVSMISKHLFAYVDARLKQIKGNQKPFGGMSVLAVGDFYQLPPVGQAKPLCVYEPCHLDLWQDHFQMITLTEIMRQKDDVAFAEMLNRIRVKQKADVLSEADRALLSQAITDPALCPDDVLHIFATNKQVHEHNTATLALLHSDITNIDADDYKKDPRTGRMTRQAKPYQGAKKELPDTLQVAEGARVMLTRNIDVSDGLVNGTFGKITRIVTCTKDDATRVNMLGLILDNENAGQRHRNPALGGSANIVYIERVEENMTQKGVVRRQFPMKLAFACTTHKVQGMTTSSAVVSLKNMFEPGMAYVALSRVTSLSGMHIIDMDEKKIYANPQITAALKSMRQARFDDIMPLVNSMQTLNRSDTLTVIHHNTEGLASHISDIKTHHELCLADVLCLTETHLQGSFVADSLHLEGYNMFKRNRHLSYTNYPQLSNRNGGGVAVYVKSHIQAHEKHYIQNVTDLEFLVVKLEAPVKALIAVVYRPPDYSVGSFLSNLGSLMDSLEIMDHHPTIVCGDFNEDLLSGTRKPIFELFQSRRYTQVITDATTEKQTLLDHIFISQPQHCLHSGVLQTYYSYHNPVFCIITSNVC